MGNRDRFLRVNLRLSTQEHHELTRQSLLRDEPPSTLARRLLLEGLGLQASHVESTTPAANIDRKS